MNIKKIQYSFKKLKKNRTKYLYAQTLDYNTSKRSEHFFTLLNVEYIKLLFGNVGSFQSDNF